MTQAEAARLAEDLFRRESGRIIAALTRLLGAKNVALAEDVAQDALVTALQVWRLGLPDDPTAWLLQVARRRAIDHLRRQRRASSLEEGGSDPASDSALGRSVELAFSVAADGENQLAMMFAICDDALSSETHVTLILRLLCGFSAAEIARAFLVDSQTIDRRLHRGRAQLRAAGASMAPAGATLAARQRSVERALYLLFNEGYHGSDPESPLHPALCADALRLVELLLGATGVARRPLHALAALFCFHAARLEARLDDEGVLVPLAEQDRGRWLPDLVERGIVHLGESAGEPSWTRWHLEAGIAFEHTRAASLATTDWRRIVDYYDALLALAPGPIVAMNRALALGELHGPQTGRAALSTLEHEAQLRTYSFYWAARADLERRADRPAEAAAHYRRAIALARSPAERRSYLRRLAALALPRE